MKQMMIEINAFCQYLDIELGPRINIMNSSNILQF